MSFSSHPHLATAVGGLAAWVLLLGLSSSVPRVNELDREVSARFIAQLPPGVALLGEGSITQPRYRLAFQPQAGPPPRAGVFLNDADLNEVVDLPPSPSDEASILSKIQKAGVRDFTVAGPLGWEKPDPFSLDSLHMVMDRLDSVTLGLPLSNGVDADLMPPPFLRLSVPVTQVEGDVSLLPVVNRVGVLHPELGGERTVAGFTELLNEKPVTAGAAADLSAPLLARWGERVVFALPLAGEIARGKLDPAQIRIELGKSILLGPRGRWIPIDARGRMAIPGATLKNDAVPETTAFPTADLFGEARVLPEDFTRPGAVVWRQEQRPPVTAAEQARMKLLAATDHALRCQPLADDPQAYPRPDILWELAGAVALSCLSGLLLGRVWKWLVLPAAAVAVWGGQFGLTWLLHAHGLMPLPLAALAIPATAGVTRLFLKSLPRVKKEIMQASAPEAETTAPEETPAPEPAPVEQEEADEPVLPVPETAEAQELHDEIAPPGEKPEPEPVPEPKKLPPLSTHRPPAAPPVVTLVMEPDDEDLAEEDSAAGKEEPLAKSIEPAPEPAKAELPPRTRPKAAPAKTPLPEPKAEAEARPSPEPKPSAKPASPAPAPPASAAPAKNTPALPPKKAARKTPKKRRRR